MLAAGCSLMLYGEREGDVLERPLRVVGRRTPARPRRPGSATVGDSTTSYGAARGDRGRRASRPSGCSRERRARPTASRRPRAHATMNGRTCARAAPRGSAEMSSHARMRQNASMPSNIAPRHERRDRARCARRPPRSACAAASTASRDLGVDRQAEPASIITPMRRPRDVALEPLPLDRLRRQAHRVALVGLREHAHHQRRVGDGARHRPGDAAGVRRIDRDAAEARLQREDAAPAGRQAHRAADVGADVQRPVARGDAGAARRRCCRPGSCSGPTGCA